MATSEAGNRRRNPSGWPSPRLRPAVKCHAHKTNGEPCPNWAMHAQKVCHAHGGRSPQALAAAEARIALAARMRVLERAVVRATRRQEKLAKWAAGILGCDPSEVDSAGIARAASLDAWEQAARSFESHPEDAA